MDSFIVLGGYIIMALLLTYLIPLPDWPLFEWIRTVFLILRKVLWILLGIVAGVGILRTFGPMVLSWIWSKIVGIF